MKRKFLILACICILLPLFFLLQWSLTDRMAWPDLFPRHLSLAAWEHIFSQKDFVKSIGISLGVSLVVMLLSMAVSLLAAFTLSQYEIKGRRWIWILLMLPMAIPAVSVAIGTHGVFLAFGMTDTFWGVVLCHLIPTIPYAVKILVYNFDLLGNEMGEQARMLGADIGRVLIDVYLPNMKPALSLSAIMVFIVSFSQYLLTFLIGGGKVKTLPILLFPMMQSGSRQEASAYSLVFILTALAGTYVIEGIIGNDDKNIMNINL